MKLLWTYTKENKRNQVLINKMLSLTVKTTNRISWTMLKMMLLLKILNYKCTTLLKKWGILKLMVNKKRKTMTRCENTMKNRMQFFNGYQIIQDKNGSIKISPPATLSSMKIQQIYLLGEHYSRISNGRDLNKSLKILVLY